MTKQDITRINELAAISRTAVGLTAAQQEEQAALRSAYVAEMRQSLKTQLDSTVIVDEQGRRTKLKQK